MSTAAVIERPYRTAKSEEVCLMDLALDTVFYVCNGDWYGSIVEVDGVKCVENTMGTFPIEGRYPPGTVHEVEICTKSGRRPKVRESQYSTSELYDADPKCRHKVKAQSGGGVKCVKCGGWLCY